ncbi:Uncharacterised protein [Staphylococcus aureus]|nr:Uncharacterised protein [Staphylococcus aureus]
MIPISFKLNTKLPIPTTKITEAITKFRLFAKSTLLSTNILKPLAAIIPKSNIDTPPITGVGIEEINAVNLPMNAKTIAITAAPPMT